MPLCFSKHHVTSLNGALVRGAMSFEHEIETGSHEDDFDVAPVPDTSPTFSQSAFFANASTPDVLQCWVLASARKRWIYVWLIAGTLCAMASFIGSISVMSYAPEAGSGCVVVFLFNLLLLLCVIPLSICVMCREGWVIIP